MRRLLYLAALLLAQPAWGQVADFPPGNVVVVSSGNVANATATATIAAQVGRLNYVNNIFVTAGGATAANVVTCTITGVQGGTLSFIYGVPTGATLPATPLNLNFLTAIPASATNTAIVVSCPAVGVGSTRMVIIVVGYFK